MWLTDMRRISIVAPVKYEMLVGVNILADLGRYLREVTGPCRTLLITDDNVAPLYADTVSVSLLNSGFSVYQFEITYGEHSKSIHTLNAILEFAAENHITKSDLFIALGGSTINDITGVAAALFRGGLRYVLVPTTLLCAIEASVTGRSSINLLAGRDLAGVRHHPCLVLCDCHTFRTLPENVFADGIAEAIRLGMISDLRLFEQFELGSIAKDYMNIVVRCVNVKRRILGQDKYECGIAELLRFGDIFADALKKYSDYSVSHANALAFGIVTTSIVAEKRGITRELCSVRLCRAFKRHNIDVGASCDTSLLIPIILTGQNLTNEKIPIILPVRPGLCRWDTISTEELCNALQVEH